MQGREAGLQPAVEHCRHAASLVALRIGRHVKNSIFRALMKRHLWLATGLAGLLVLGGLLFLFALVATDPGDNIVLTSRGVKTDESGQRLVVGTLQNRTGGTFTHVQVEIAFLDEAGSVVGSTVARTQDLGGGETWRFAAPVPAPAAVRARLANLACTRVLAPCRPDSCHLRMNDRAGRSSTKRGRQIVAPIWT